jgi:type II secretory pathway pseudopilin PulG
VELLVVAAIILILAGIMSVNYFLARQKTQESVDSANKYTKDANDIIHASYE